MTNFILATTLFHPICVGFSFFTYVLVKWNCNKINARKTLIEQKNNAIIKLMNQSFSSYEI